ncbi:DNA cytosine methyltransferase [Aphanothece sacrum]|uniref:DNA (Cytosine-5-)-methyltransferase n=1 Tax=Aphanothece sacrum FPU1 TaxID=1920663 RepID=A0A401IFV5_APHSA|nr:DNA cytosine methyltransferase [Aphanothece sacrum]GBF80094.1 DNA (cytosine-5-)-methyltransferase [Aphanothece sacrum FPU1]GBF87029.1 DNA (cytosine-5-)-methyltransferase [Aphanothece sacrum FPU3]
MGGTQSRYLFHIPPLIFLGIRPPVVILENVKHLIHHQQGKTLETIIYALEDLGYLVDYKLLNAKDWLSQHLGIKCIISYNTLYGGLRRALKLISFSSKS